LSKLDKAKKMFENPWGSELVLCQLDLELVQSQATVRYLAKRAGIQGKTTEEQVKCDMIVESVRDLLNLVTQAPFQRVAVADEGAPNPWEVHLKNMKTKWAYQGSRYEAILLCNKESKHKLLVDDSLTYADILVAHVSTWFVEECGAAVMADMPNLVALQNMVISMPGIQEFIKNNMLYFPLGDAKYVNEVNTVLGRV